MFRGMNSGKAHCPKSLDDHYLMIYALHMYCSTMTNLHRRSNQLWLIAAAQHT